MKNKYLIYPVLLFLIFMLSSGFIFESLYPNLSTPYLLFKNISVILKLQDADAPPVNAYIDSVVPMQNKLNVPLTSDIKTYFTQSMNSSTMDNNTVTFFGSMTGRMGGTITYNSGNNSMQIVPSNPFKYGELISTTLDSGIKTSSGNSIIPFVYSFTTLTKSSNLFFNYPFAIGVGNSPRGIAAGDFNGDGYIDIAVSNYGAASVSILTNNGSGSFSESSSISVQNGPFGIISGDFNGDGYLDLAVPNIGANSISIIKNNGSGIFTVSSTIAVGSSPAKITTGDFNGDGDMDIAVTSMGSTSISILMNDGTGSYSVISKGVGYTSNGIATGDFNKDGDLDLAVSRNNSNSIQFFQNNGAGTFSFSSSNSTNGPINEIATGDYDKDGDIDVAVSEDNTNTVSILNNNGSAIFSLSSSIGVPTDPYGITSGDYDGDGDLDLGIANNGDNSISILKNNESGNFTLFSTLTADSLPIGITSSDFNNDGVLDFATSNNGSNNVSILLNHPPDIDSVSPHQNKLNVPLTSSIMAYFHQSMNSTTIDSNNISLFGSMSGRKQGNITYNSGNNSLQIIPSNPFKYGELISITLDSGIKSNLGFSIMPFFWNFTASTKPSNLIFDQTSSITVGNLPIDIIVGDYDGDGDLDLALTNNESYTVSILTNNGTGSFSISSSIYFGYGSKPFYITAGDFDKDGDLDLAVTNNGYYYKMVTILKNNGDATFTYSSDINLSGNASKIATGDFDNNGDLDLVISYQATNSISILKNDGIGGFTVQSTVSVINTSSDIAAADFNNDGYLDIAISNPNSNKISILNNDGTGTLRISSTLGIGSPIGITSGDFDGDGYVDLSVTNSGNTVSILKNNGTGTFTVASNNLVGSNPNRLNSGDLDGDGDLDLAVTNSSSSSLSILNNNGNGSFTSLSSVGLGSNPNSISIGDFNNDGVLDITTIHSFSNNLSILLNVAPPILISPTNNSMGNLASLIFSWKKFLGVSNYRFQLSTDSLFNSTIIDDSTLLGIDSIKSVSGLSFGTSYFWRMSSKSVNGTSLWSDTWKFNTLGVPTKVTLCSPVNNVINQPLIITFQWYKSIDQIFTKDFRFNEKNSDEKRKTKSEHDSPDAISKYWFEYGSDSTFTSVIARDSSLSDTTKTITGLSIITRYFWRVKAKNESGWSDFSEIWNFTTLYDNIIWTKMSSGIGENLSIIALASGNNNYLFSAIKNGSIYRTSNYGINWSNTNLNAPDLRNIATHGLYTFACSYGASGNALYRSANNGGSWSVLNPASIYYLFTVASNNLYLYLGRSNSFGSGGGVWRSADNGSTFSYMNNGLNKISVYVLAAKGSEVYAGTRGSGIYYSGNNCDNWTPARFELSNWNIYALELSGSNVFAGTDGGIFLSTNRGVNWSAVNSGLTNLSVRSLAASGNNIFAGTKGGIFFSSNNGVNWVEKNQGLNPIDSVTSLILANNYIFAGTGGNSVWRSEFAVQLPDVPVLLSPSNDSTGNLLSVILKWSKPLTSKVFHLIVSTDSLFTNKIVNDSLLTDTLKILSLSPLTNYYWKVRAKNTTGWSEFSTRYRFKTMGAPIQSNLSFPANNATNQPVNVMFKWFRSQDQTIKQVIKRKDGNEYSNNVDFVINYWFELVRDTLSMSNLLRDSLVADTIKFVSGLETLKDYYWRVKSKNEIGWSNFSNWSKFTTISSPDFNYTALPALGNSTTIFGATELIFIANVSTQKSVTVFYFTVAPVFGELPIGILSVSNYYWSIQDSGIVFTDGLIKIPLAALGGVTDPTKLVILKRSFAGDSWINIGGIIQDGYLISTLPISTFSEFAIGSQDSQPLQNSYLNLTVIPEGYYNNSLNRLNMKDTITVLLRSVNSPFSIIDSARGILDSLTFTTKVAFKIAPTGSYYIVIKHRNSLETWSKLGGILFTKYSSMSYNFTSSNTQAYGNNLVLKNGFWCIISGDINQDGTIDLNDIIPVLSDYDNLDYHLANDLNLDATIDLNDAIFVLSGYDNLFGAITPVIIMTRNNMKDINTGRKEILEKVERLRGKQPVQRNIVK